ncbi:MAG: hypothetical protein ABDK94_02510 [Atribacterota bacterium]
MVTFQWEAGVSYREAEKAEKRRRRRPLSFASCLDTFGYLMVVQFSGV